MTEESNVARETARILIETKSVLFNAENPFTLTSGRKSPVYIDCRRLISFPAPRANLMRYAADMLRREVGEENMDYVAGGETAGIPYAAFIADRLARPMLYVRKQPKGFGRMAQIEGHIPDGVSPKVVLVEDLQTDGGSKKVFIDALRQAGTKVEHSFVIFHYGIFPQSEKNMKDLGVQLHALTTWWDVLAYAQEKACFDDDTLDAVEDFLHNPESWQDISAQEGQG